ncbi:MAG: hypothetical protein KUG74_01065 [Rhodobacteraceae bacterium]|nr:hypothetical protein [Paracoccaceae bacterium]
MPVLVWGISALGAAFGLAWAGKEAGEEIGKSVGKTVPMVVGAGALYLAYKAVKK